MKITTYNKLHKYESYLYTAKYASYIRSLTNPQVEELIAAGADLGIGYANNHCPKCLLNFITKLANPYFEQKERMAEGRKNKKVEKKQENNDEEHA